MTMSGEDEAKRKTIKKLDEGTGEGVRVSRYLLPSVGPTEDLIPSEAIQHLPFQKEPMDHWEPGLDLSYPSYILGELIQGFPIGIPSDTPGTLKDLHESRPHLHSNTDVLEFLYDLYGKVDVIYRPYGLVKYSTGVTRFRQWAQQFQTLAHTPNDFLSNTDFGRMAKYAIAWRGVVSNVISENAFFSLAHFLESEEDLDCSVLLAASMYYKQAFQVLRNYLEGAVLQIHFCENPMAFRDWRAGSYRVPSFRGKKGLLKKLVDCGLLSEDLKCEASDLYHELNGCIHGAERRLIHSGVHLGEGWIRKVDPDKFVEWCDFFSRVVDLGIRLARIHLGQWSSQCEREGVFCNRCHNDTDFDFHREEWGGRKFIRYHCRQCGSEMLRDAWREDLNDGVAHYRQGRLDDAIHEFQAALDTTPDIAEAHVGLGAAYAQQGRLNDAIREFQDALRINPNFAEAHYSLGAAYHQQGCEDEAVQAYQAALRINPEHAMARCNLGVVYKQLGRLDEAIREFRVALRISPNDSVAHVNLGGAYMLQDRLDEAIREFQAALQLDPDDARAHIQLGAAYGQQERWDDEIREYQAASQINPDDSDAHFLLGMAYAQQGRFDEAICEIRTALRISPDDAEAHVGLGWVYGQQGRLDDAIREYQEALSINPDDAKAHHDLGETYWEQDRKKDAIREWQAAQRINPDIAETHFSLGRAYREQDGLNGAIREYETALRINPDYAEAHYNLSMAYAERGLLDEAVREAQLALRLGCEPARELLMDLRRVLGS